MKRWLLSMAWLLLMTGCAEVPVAQRPPPPALFHDAVFGPPAVPVRPDEVFAVSPAMREFLAREAWRMRLKGGPSGLVDGLLESGVLKLDYDSEMTRNAAEAFEARSGNCLSLVIMTAALARELGLSVVYRQIETGGVWSRSGTLLMDMAHVNISIARDHTGARVARFIGDWVTVDFMAGANSPHARVWQLEERRILAMYLVNRAVELMAASRSADAYWHARAAIEADPGFVEAYNTLGVVYLRHGRPRESAVALRHTLALDPGHRHARGNLATVLDVLGQAAEAAALRAELQRLDPVPPFRDYDDGLRAMQAGDFETARRLFERELKNHDLQFHELHLNLARVYLHFGNHTEARRQLEKALKLSTTRQQQALYTSKLDALKEERARLGR